ncbi:methyltransferase-like protein 23 isoform X3 [Pistacia vera]|uniref:methyltransferase-like protein 23 isoform X2 n=1 Tax=Pistacia vera TaxID=55513 RepID=UPI00126398FE|nr:methyltransferase-like protein 23 isoform X2 [Pistacia vera]XP_031262674.1 methyltransferase-like protein 23 isoform X3 [Pistacia vera]
MNKFDAVPSEEEVDDENSDKCMSTISRHFFGNELDKPSFSISILENMKEEYGLFVWPCSIILAEYVWQQRFRFSGVSVVELGAGTSLPGLVAAKVGSDVTLTDDSDRIEVMGLTWGVWDASVFNLHPKIILGADVFYDTSAFDDLFATVTFLLKNSPGSVFITTYHNRSGHHLIEFLMVKWGLKCVKLLDGFSFLPPDKASGLSGNIQLAEIVLSGELTEVLHLTSL